ncbi:MAG TPA: sugar ABC transporter substrate-binding protein [Solirubrobacterales bacterium]|nr:sugar ABC transporter substrate-binding protein [Solirubrobacterales bacterium]
MKGKIGRTRLLSLFAVLLAALLCVGVVTACGSSSSSGGSETTANEEEAATSEEGGGEEEAGAEEGEEGGASLAALKTEVEELSTEPSGIVQPKIGLKPFTPKAGGKIYNISCDLSIVGCTTVSGEIRKATETIGYGYQLCNGGASPEAPNTCFTQAINAKPSAIVVNAIGSEVAAQGYEAAKAAGIPVIGVFTGDPGDGSVAEVQTGASEESTGCYEQGTIIAKAITAESEGKANTLFLTENAIGCDVARQEGFEAEFPKVCPECKYEKLQFNTETIENTLPQQVQAALNSNPELNWVVGVYDQAASIAATQVLQAGKGDQISVAGMDGNPENVELMLKKQVQKFDLAFDLGPVAWSGVDAAARIYSGQKVGTEVPRGVPAQQYLLTWDNVASLGPSKTWAGPPHFEEEFKELWNGK